MEGKILKQEPSAVACANDVMHRWWFRTRKALRASFSWRHSWTIPHTRLYIKLLWRHNIHEKICFHFTVITTLYKKISMYNTRTNLSFITTLFHNHTGGKCINERREERSESKVMSRIAIVERTSRLINLRQFVKRLFIWKSLFCRWHWENYLD